MKDEIVVHFLGTTPLLRALIAAAPEYVPWYIKEAMRR